MTRDELADLLDILTDPKTDFEQFELYLNRFWDYDTEQRRTIEQQAKEIKSLQTCQCEGCDESLEGAAYCQCCWMKQSQTTTRLREALGHAVLRDHTHNQSICDACKQAQRALEETK